MNLISKKFVSVSYVRAGTVAGMNDKFGYSSRNRASSCTA